MNSAMDLLRSTLMMGWVTLWLWICATEFDSTELKAIGGIAAGLFAAKGADWLAKLKGNGDACDNS